MGRHHPLLDRDFPWRSLFAVVAVGVVLGASIAVIRDRTSPAGGAPGDAAGCGGGIQLDVGADPTVQPWLSTLAESYTGLGRQVAGSCARAVVRTVQPWSIGGTVRAASGGAPQDDLDVWVSESSTTFGLARAAARMPALAVPVTSIASSPLALAMPRDAVQQLRVLARREPRFADLLTLAQRPAGWGRLSTGQPEWGPIKFSTLDPGRTTVGASFVTAAVGTLTGQAPKDVGATAFGQVDARDGLFSFVRTLVAAPSSGPALLQQAAATASTRELLGKVGILAVYEQDVWNYNGRQPTVALRATYPLGGQLAADFPLAVLAGPWVDDGERAVAEDFRSWLLSDSAQQQLAGFGLRRADGTTGPELTEPGRGLTAARIEPVQPVTPEGPAAAQSAWQLITRPLSTLSLVDVSGSMAAPVDGTANRTRLDLAKEAAIAALGFTQDRDSIGLWEFSQRLAGERDHRQLVGLGPASDRVGRFPDRRAAVVAAWQGMRPRTGTGLYDSVLAAYAAASASYRPDAVNTVLLLSDGRNEDRGSITLGQLLTRLKAAYRADRPVHVVALAYGPEADRAELGRIAAATRGTVFAAADPRTITEAFINAVARLPRAG